MPLRATSAILLARIMLIACMYVGGEFKWNPMRSRKAKAGDDSSAAAAA